MTSIEGAWQESALQETLKSSFGAGSDADLPEGVRFLHGVANLGRRYFENCDESERGLSIFILYRGRPSGLEQRTEYVPMLRNGRQHLSGRVWLTTHRVNESFSIDIGHVQSDGEAWEFVREELGCGDLPTVVVDSRGGKVVANFYPEGVNAPELEEESDLTRAVIDRDALFSAIDSIYMDDLRTPDAQGEASNAWASASAGRPSDKAEKYVQRVLKIGLTRAFPDFIVRPEQPQIEGRTDLEIEQQLADDPTSVTRHFVIEIKVLRDVSSTGNTTYPKAQVEADIGKGLGQAVAYRDGKPARDAILCSFDMRKEYVGAAVYDFILNTAIEKAVALWVWHLFHSSDEMRKRMMVGLPIGGERAC